MNQWEESPSDRLHRLLDEEDEGWDGLMWNDAMWVTGAILITLLVFSIFC